MKKDTVLLDLTAWTVVRCRGRGTGRPCRISICFAVLRKETGKVTWVARTKGRTTTCGEAAVLALDVQGCDWTFGSKHHQQVTIAEARRALASSTIRSIERRGFTFAKEELK